MKYRNEREKMIAIAWFLAGEGTITMASITRKDGRIAMFPRVRAANTDLGLLKKFKSLVGDGHIYATHKNRTKPLWQWEMFGIKRIIPFLVKIKSFMPSKQVQIVAIFEFVALRKKRGGAGRWNPYGKGEYEILEKIRKANLKPHQNSYKWKFLDRWYYSHKNTEGKK